MKDHVPPPLSQSSHLPSNLIHANLGKFKCVPNSKNPRDLEITVSYSFKGKEGAWEGSQHYKMR